MNGVVGWLSDWLRSPGFGGLAAVVAATIAYRAASRAAAVSRASATADRQQRDRSERKSQWWKRAEWALDLTLDDDTRARQVGYEVLDALARSEWADEHENDVIAAATTHSLGSDVETRLLDSGDALPHTGAEEDS